MAGFLQLLEKTWQPGGIPLSPAALSLEIEALLCPSVWEVAVWLRPWGLGAGIEEVYADQPLGWQSVP